MLIKEALLAKPEAIRALRLLDSVGFPPTLMMKKQRLADLGMNFLRTPGRTPVQRHLGVIEIGT